ncbi:MAG: putative Fe-S protein [Promethearchaeota archaeon]|nr:MAG: putative Fe-S protein [Candidatus Lokiarchaeota archaeon]
MNLDELQKQIKQLTLNSGAKLVGVGSRERLEKAPSSANMGYCLPEAKSCIIWVYPNPINALENYFAKKERMSIKQFQYFAYTSAWTTAQRIKQFIEDNTEYKAFAVIPNGKYRKEEGSFSFLEADLAYPDFSLRYGAVAAGLGHLGWSGNLVTKEYGGSLYLAGVLTTAPLKPDPMAEENYCNKCKVCFQACTTGYFDKDKEEDIQEVIIGGYKEIYAKRGTYSKCGIGCAGLVGVSEDNSWSTWTANHICIKQYPNQEWKAKPFIRKQIMKKILIDKNTPSELRKFNKRIVKSFAKVAAHENTGLRPLKDTNPRCGNCSFICVADHKKRIELLELLKNSGKLYLDEEGREFVRQITKNGEEVTYYPPTEKEFFSNLDKKE